MIEKYFSFKTSGLEIKRNFIIAEIGSNHCREIKLAFELIGVAKECGADAVKFQSLNLNELYYQPSKGIKNLFGKISLDESWYGKLKSYSDKKKIIFFSSPAYLRAVDLLEDIGVEIYKLASAQACAFPQLIDKVARLNKPILLSAGLLTQKELMGVINIIRSTGNERLVILHCNSIYPTPYRKVNLRLIKSYQDRFNKPVGFSDHTKSIYMPIAAAAFGAKVIEKHLMLDEKCASPDRGISLLPHQFKSMVQGIRAVEEGLGSGERTRLESEENEFRKNVLYRLILKNNKRKNERFVCGDFDFKRYHKGIDCRKINEILKHFKARTGLRKGILLTPEKLIKIQAAR